MFKKTDKTTSQTNIAEESASASASATATSSATKPKFIKNETGFKPKLGNAATESFQFSSEDLAEISIEQDKLRAATVAVKAEPEKDEKPFDYFGSSEHIAIGDNAFQEFCIAQGSDFLEQLLEPAKELAEKFNDPATPGGEKFKIKLTLKDSLKLSAGEIVALAGDFYGDATAPISFGQDDSERSKRFKQAFKQLEDADTQEVQKILGAINIEEQAVKDAIQRGEKPNVVLEALEASQNERYANLTRFTFFPVPWTNLDSRYIQLSSVNFDHFNQEAKIAYGAGHQLALFEAEAAFFSLQANDTKTYWQRLVRAFTIELYACHFFTDLFAAGHVRTPRREILEYVEKESYRITPKKTGIAGLLAKEMHDEDGQLGIWLRSKSRPEPWFALGDSCYYEQENIDNAQAVLAAVKASLQDIYDASLGKKINKERYLDDIPVPLTRQQVIEKFGADETRGLHYPLFIVEKDGVKCRQNVNDLQCNEYVKVWSPLPTLVDRMSKPAREFVESSQETLSEAASAAKAGITAGKNAVENKLAEVVDSLKEEVNDMINNGCKVS